MAALTCVGPSTLHAQDLAPQDSAPVTTDAHRAETLITSPPPPDFSKEERELAQLEREADRQWIALITSGSVGIAGVGLFLGGRDSARQGIKSTGIAFMATGGTGALVSGMMLAAGATKRRRLELWIEARSLAKFHWDVRSGSFVF